LHSNFMLGFRDQFASDNDPRLQELSRRMSQFYESVDDYTVFKENVVTGHEGLWKFVRADLRQRLDTHSVCRALEFGAGRTGFARSLGDIRSKVHFVAQDITSQNQDFLIQEADSVHIGPLDTLPDSEPFDAIFSTYVFEHLTHPRDTLDRCMSLLRPGGTLFICCPRYDWPFRLSPSADHYGGPRWTGLALSLMASRFRTWLTGDPRFWVHLDPAILHLGWQRDRDAIHWASYGDIQAYAKGRYLLRPLSIEKPRKLRAWIRVHLLTMAFGIQKPLVEAVPAHPRLVPLATLPSPA
jgi:SAM-dependent methyltransferase